MTDFINVNQKLLVIETNNLRFGNGSTIDFDLEFDESVTTSTPSVSASITNGPTGLAVSVKKDNTSKPTLTLTLGGIVSDYTLGTIYNINITANGNTDSIGIQFLFSSTYDPSSWTNSPQEDSVGGFFTLNNIPAGSNIYSTIVNSKFKPIFEFVNLLNFKIVDIVSKYRLKRNLSDIINSAIYAGAIPQGYTGKVTYVNTTTNIDNIILQDSINDTDSFTKIQFNYIQASKTIKNNSVTPATITQANYDILDSIEVSRVSDNTGSVKKYRIANVKVTRSDTTFTSVVDSSYSITMPLVTGWTVTE